MKKKIAIYKILEWVLICTTLILLGMALCLLIYSEHLCCDKGSDWVRYFVFAVMLYLIQIVVRNCRHLEEREAHRKFIQFIEEQLKEEQEGEEEDNRKNII